MNNKVVLKEHLRNSKVEKFFDVVLSAHEISKPKPSPDIFIKCAKKLDIDECEFVVI